MKASATAHPVQDLIGCEGELDDRFGLPVHDSIAVCLAPLRTDTTVDFGKFDNDVAILDGVEARGREFEAVSRLVDALRLKADCPLRFRSVSISSYPRSAGLGYLSSVCASSVLAACGALGLDTYSREVMDLAVKGSAQWVASILGGFSRLNPGLGGGDSRSRLIRSDELQMGVLAILVPGLLRTGSTLRRPLRPPLATPRMPEVFRLLDEMELALREGDVGKVCILAERDSLLARGASVTGLGEELHWSLETLKVIRTVRGMRSEGTPAFFSMGHDDTIYINTLPARLEDVSRRVLELGVQFWKCNVGGPARVIDEHLF